MSQIDRNKISIRNIFLRADNRTALRAERLSLGREAKLRAQRLGPGFFSWLPSDKIAGGGEAASKRTPGKDRAGKPRPKLRDEGDGRRGTAKISRRAQIPENEDISGRYKKSGTSSVTDVYNTLDIFLLLTPLSWRNHGAFVGEIFHFVLACERTIDHA